MNLVELLEAYVVVAEHVQEHHAEGVYIRLKAIILLFSGTVSDLLRGCKA